MTKVVEIEGKALAEWVATKTEVVQDLCRRFPPDRLYLLKTTNYRVTLYSYSEDGTMTVNVTGEYNKLLFDRRVFGIKPEDLEECDLPGKDEQLGTLFTDPEDVDACIDAICSQVSAEMI
ncbi:MAG: hypothetical protein AB2745_08630 [Candidatus Thiodiazotropha endolucinida]